MLYLTFLIFITDLFFIVSTMFAKQSTSNHVVCKHPWIEQSYCDSQAGILNDWEKSRDFCQRPLREPSKNEEFGSENPI